MAFTALVSNASESTLCLMPEQLVKFCSRFGLPCAKLSRVEVCKDYDQVCDNLYVEFHETSVASIDKSNMGSRYYLVKRSS